MDRSKIAALSCAVAATGALLAGFGVAQASPHGTWQPASESAVSSPHGTWGPQ